MRVLILGDMEGVSGIQSWEHTGGASPLYDEGRRLYTDDVNAAVRGCKAGGASSVVAQDGHGGAYPNGKAFMNWIPDRLEGGAEYVRGYRWARYVEPFERGECDAVAFVGAHAMAGAPNAVLCHTVSADGWHAVRLNGVDIGECGILAAIAGSFGVPAACVAGDEAACDELYSLVGPGLVTAAVKRGYGRYAARMLAPADARALIEERFCHAIATPTSWPRPYVPPPPIDIEVEMASPDRVTPFAGLAGVCVRGPRTIGVTGATFWEAWSLLWQDS